MWRGSTPTCRNPSCLPALRHVGRRVSAVEKVAHRLGEVAQRLLLDGLRSGFKPVVFGASLRQLGTLFVVAGRPATWLPVPSAVRRQDSTQTGHGDSVRPMLSPAQGWGATETCPHQQPRQDLRQHAERREAAFPAPGKSRGFARHERDETPDTYHVGGAAAGRPDADCDRDCPARVRACHPCVVSARRQRGADDRPRPGERHLQRAITTLVRGHGCHRARWRYWSTGQPTVRGAVVSVKVRPLGPTGSYTVNYRVTSADGHVVSGILVVSADSGRHRLTRTRACCHRRGRRFPTWPFVVVALVLVVGTALWAMRRRA